MDGVVSSHRRPRYVRWNQSTPTAFRFHLSSHLSISLWIWHNQVCPIFNKLDAIRFTRAGFSSSIHKFFSIHSAVQINTGIDRCIVCIGGYCNQLIDSLIASKCGFYLRYSYDDTANDATALLTYCSRKACLGISEMRTVIECHCSQNCDLLRSLWIFSWFFSCCAVHCEQSEKFSIPTARSVRACARNERFQKSVESMRIRAQTKSTPLKWFLESPENHVNSFFTLFFPHRNGCEPNIERHSRKPLIDAE